MATVVVNAALPPVSSISYAPAAGGPGTLSATGRIFVWKNPAGVVVYSTVFRNGGLHSVTAPAGGNGMYTLTVYDGACSTSATVMK